MSNLNIKSKVLSLVANHPECADDAQAILAELINQDQKNEKQLLTEAKKKIKNMNKETNMDKKDQAISILRGIWNRRITLHIKDICHFTGGALENEQVVKTKIRTFGFAKIDADGAWVAIVMQNNTDSSRYHMAIVQRKTASAVYKAANMFLPNAPAPAPTGKTAE